MNIITVYEGRRGCGFRKAGGLYLRFDGLGSVCGALPIECGICPTCHGGIKPSRGWTWINLAAFAAVRGCDKEAGCGNCPIADARIQRVGLLWIGEQYYPTTRDFSNEAVRMGLSRRISAIPRDFKVGETWVALAHRKAIELPFEFGKDPEFKAGIFHVFCPSRIEYVVREFDSEEKLQSLADRGITLVRVIQREEPELKADAA